MAKIIKSDGTEIIVNPSNGSDFDLSELQEIVGGYIEPIHLNEKEFMIVNEEGFLKRLPFNEKASKLIGNIIVGDVLVCGVEQIK